MTFVLLKVCSYTVTWTAARTRDSDTEKLVMTNHTPSTFSIIETWILTCAKCFFGTLDHHHLGLLTSPKMSVFLDVQKNVTSLSEFLGLSCCDNVSLDSVMRLLSYSERHSGSPSRLTGRQVRFLALSESCDQWWSLISNTSKPELKNSQAILHLLLIHNGKGPDL